MRRSILATGALCAFAAISAATSARKPLLQPPMPAGYDDAGPAPENVLPQVIAKLRTTLKDPYSIRDLTICPPNRIDAYYGVDWVHARWDVKVTLNSKNSFGGYVGSTLYHVSFENGEATKATEFKGISVLSPAVNERLVAMSRSCPRVSDAEIQRLLAN